MQFLGDHTDIFQSPVIWYSCPSPVIDYEMEFVKMQFQIKSISLRQQLTKKSEIYTGRNLVI